MLARFVSIDVIASHHRSRRRRRRRRWRHLCAETRVIDDLNCRNSLTASQSDQFVATSAEIDPNVAVAIGGVAARGRQQLDHLLALLV